MRWPLAALGSWLWKAARTTTTLFADVRSRVVPASRCWRRKDTGGSVARVAVDNTHDQERWRKSRPPGRARTRPFQPSCAERRTVSGATVATTLVCFLLLHTGLRTRSERPAFRAPSYEGEGTSAPPVRIARGNNSACAEAI